MVARVTQNADDTCWRVLTRDEVRAVVEAELFSLDLKETLTPTQMKVFCEYIERNFPYQSNADRMLELVAWTEGLPVIVAPGQTCVR